MNLDRQLQSQTKWIVRSIGWVIALAIIFGLIYRMAIRKQVEQAVNCLDKTASEERATTPLASVDKYAKCIAGSSANKPTAIPARCRYAGVWAASRDGATYNVTLQPDGRFIAEPGQNSPPNATTITGAWGVAGKTLVWVYDSGAVWPPDINPISAESEKGFTLGEVGGGSTRYTLGERNDSGVCRK